jgi:ATP-dependent protease ClpP protease subunit
MFHGAGYDLAAGTHLKVQNLKEHMNALIADEARMADIISSRSKLDINQATELFREARTKNANDALSAGLVDTVADVQMPPGAKVVTIVVN